MTQTHAMNRYYLAIALGLIGTQPKADIGPVGFGKLPKYAIPVSDGFRNKFGRLTSSQKRHLKRSETVDTRLAA